MGTHEQDPDELEVNAIRAALAAKEYQLACELILNSAQTSEDFLTAMGTRDLLHGGVEITKFIETWTRLTTYPGVIPGLCPCGGCRDSWVNALIVAREKWHTLKNTTQP